jgi:hypothetical protein
LSLFSGTTLRGLELPGTEYAALSGTLNSPTR